jgi:hypothetical protein
VPASRHPLPQCTNGDGRRYHAGGMELESLAIARWRRVVKELRDELDQKNALIARLRAERQSEQLARKAAEHSRDVALKVASKS